MNITDKSFEQSPIPIRSNGLSICGSISVSDRNTKKMKLKPLVFNDFEMQTEWQKSNLNKTNQEDCTSGCFGKKFIVNPEQINFAINSDKIQGKVENEMKNSK